MGKTFSKVERAYVAGLIDADGAIMAFIERHPEKKFNFRVRIVVKLTQKDPFILHWLKRKLLVYPFLKIKKKQAKIALQIIATLVKTVRDLLKVARLADSLSLYNPRSRKRRKNFTAMIEENLSPND